MTLFNRVLKVSHYLKRVLILALFLSFDLKIVATLFKLSRKCGNK